MPDNRTTALPQWERFREPLWRTIVRNLGIAIAVAACLALRRGNLSLILPFTTLAAWFTFGGHFTEVLFLNDIRFRLPRTRGIQIAARLALWWLCGCFLYLGMSATLRAVWREQPHYSALWIGGFLLIGIELVAHLVALLRRRPNFYEGTA